MKHTKTLKLRLKDKHARVLRAMSREVNLVWNYCNETSHRAIRERRQWLSGFDLQKLVNGISKCEGVQIGSATAQQVCEDYAKARKQFKRARLNWRVSNPDSAKYSSGWVPFKARAVQYQNGQVVFAGQRFGLWDSYGLGNYQLRAGSFSEDSRGRWYLNVCVQVEVSVGSGTASVGIDLGLKDAATTSDGEVLIGRQYRALEQKLGIAQRAGKKARVRAIHAKIKNQRKDAQHKFSTALVQRCAALFVGDVASGKLVKTKMAKSTLDAGWGQLKTMLEQKCQRAGVVFEVVNESYTTQTCSCCGSISASSPKGRAGLRIREWTCVDCGTAHDRDINAARNILAAGHRRLAVGIPALGGEDVNGEISQLRRQLGQQQCAPGGYKQVPFEPTPEMTWAAVNAGGWDAKALAKWRAMLAAAPSPVNCQDETRAQLIEGLDEITALSRNLRHGGCDTSDLGGLEEGLTHAVDLASELLTLLVQQDQGGSDAKPPVQCATCNDSACDSTASHLVPCPDCAAAPAEDVEREEYIQRMIEERDITRRLAEYMWDRRNDPAIAPISAPSAPNGGE